MASVSTLIHALFSSRLPPDLGRNVQEASLRRQISMKLLMSEISRGMLAVFDWTGYGLVILETSFNRIYRWPLLQFDVRAGDSAH